MTKLFYALPFALLISGTVFSQDAARDLDTDYQVYENQFLPQKELGTANEQAKPYNEEDFTKATNWKSDELQNRFEMIRDEKIIPYEGSLEPASWKYPDDGCYSRAAVANRIIFEHTLPVPKKVFAFGNLRVKTELSPRGVVGWWYHVAPIVEVQGTLYVIDPSIEFSKPLTLKEWLGKMGDPKKIKVSICKSGTYMPASSCEKETDGVELTAMKAQEKFKEKEEERLETLEH